MSIFVVHLDNNEWPEDRSRAFVLVSAENADKARELVHAYGDPLNTRHMPITDVEEDDDLSSPLENCVVTYFLA